MSRIKKMLSLVLLFVMIVSMLPQITLVAFAANYTIKTPTMSNSSYFSALPGVYEMGDGYAVIWATTFKGTGYIQYTYKGKTYTVYDEKNGIVRTGDNIHVVKVPYEHLQGNSYTVYSKEVTSHNWANTNYGITASCGPITLKKYDGGTKDFDFLVLTDVHKLLDWAKNVSQKFKEPDLIVFSGDTVSKLNTKNDIVQLFNIMGSVSHGSNGQVPMVYIRGNHECRGPYSTTLLEYLPTKTGEYYFDFRYGPLYSVVLDTSEDKADQHWKTTHDRPRNEYGQLANYYEYNQRQEAWLRTLKMDESATFRLGIYHIPRIHALTTVNDCTYNLAQYIEHLGIQFGIAGHMHLLGAYYDAANQSATKLKHTVFQCGGGDDVAEEKRSAVMVTMNASTQKAYVTAKYSSGKTDATYNNYAFDFNQYIGEPPATIPEPERGLANHFDKSKAYNAGTIRLDTQPAVFETGGDWYNVIWKTSYNSTTSVEEYTPHGATGYVEYTYNGKTYQVFDEVGGTRRTFDDYHTVRIPKEHLNNNTYKVGSFLMLYDYVYPSTNTSMYYLAGNYVESPEYLFEDRSTDDTVNLISCPDMNFQAADANLEYVVNAVAGLGTSPAYILLNGNANYISYDGAAFTNLIKAAATVSGSIHPVILSRGHAECRGAVAPNLLKYLPTATGEYYYSVKVGDYTLVNLDTAEDDPDGQVESGKSKYGDRVHLNEKRREQLAWINSLDSGDLIAVSAMPLTNLDKKFGLGYEAALKRKGAVISIGGHASSFTLQETVDSDSIYAVIPNGNAQGMDVASVLISDGCAYIKECKYSADGITTYPTEKAVSLSTGSTQKFTATKPPQSGTTFTVSTPGHLLWISENCKTPGSFSGYTFKMGNDIDMMLVPFTPIGGNDSVSSDSDGRTTSFAGTFDGNGYAIKNLNIFSTASNVGLFGSLEKGMVKDLTLSGGMVTGGWFTGALVGYSFGGIMEDCYSDLLVYASYGNGGGTKVGGLVGFMAYGSSVIRCANYGTVIGTHSGGSAGGIVGQVYSSTLNTITDTYNRGRVLARGTSGLAGGIFGYIGGAALTITNCYNAAMIASPGAQGAIYANSSSDAQLKISNTYFAKGCGGATTAQKSGNSWKSAAGSGTITAYSQDTMKDQAFADKLGSGVFTCVPVQNDGYPVHWNAIHHGGGTHSYAPSVTTPPTCTTPGVRNYICSCGASYASDSIPATGHNYKTVITAATCATDGKRVSTCTQCSDQIITTIPATGHKYIWDTCSACGYVNKNYVQPVYYLFGYINGANYGCEEDYANLGSYRFVDGKVSAIFKEDSYVGVKTGDNSLWYMTDGWQGFVSSATLYNTNDLTETDKLYVPANTYVTFTLRENPDGSLYLSYEAAACNHDYVCTSMKEASCTTDGQATYKCSICKDVKTEVLYAPGHRFVWDTCRVCGYVNEGYIKPVYYLFGYINGADYGCEADYTNMGDYRFVNGQLHAIFTDETYIAVKTEGNGTWYMTHGWQGTDRTSVTLYDSANDVTADKLYVPLYQHLIFTLTENTDGSLTLSYKTDETDHCYQKEAVPPNCTESGYTIYTCPCGDIYLDDDVPATGHSYNLEITEATCAKEGVKISTCRVCRHTVTKVLPILEHRFAWGSCSGCGMKDETYVNPVFYLFGYINGIDYGCEADYQNMGIYQFVNGQLNVVFTQDSYVGVKTEGNGAWYMTDGWHDTDNTSVKLYETTDLASDANKLYIPANTPITFWLSKNSDGSLQLSYGIADCAHDYQTVTREEPTCTINGMAFNRCSLCQATCKDLLPAWGHSYVKGICQSCGAEDPDYTPSAVVPKITLAYPTLSFEEEILMNIYFSVENEQDVLGMGLITYDTKVTEWNINNAKSVVSGYTWSEGSHLYYVTTEGIAAKCLNDTIYFAVYALLADGSYSYTGLYSYSPKTYAYNQLKTGSPEMKALVVAMLNYGAAAQNYFEYRTDALVNADLTEEQRSFVSDYSESMIASIPLPNAVKLGEMAGNGGYTKRYPTVSFEGVFCINYYFQPSAKPVGDVIMYVWDQPAYEAAKTLSRDNASEAIFMTLTDSGEYLAIVNDIVARDLDRGIYVAFCYSDGTTDYCSGVVGYSIGNYCKSQASRTGTLAQLAKATAVYGYYAKFLTVLSIGTE